MKKIAYLGMDVHARHCVLGHMDSNGNFMGNITFSTSEQNIIEALKSITAKEKYLAMEEGNLAYWVAQVSKPYVTEGWGKVSMPRPSSASSPRSANCLLRCAAWSI